MTIRRPTPLTASSATGAALSLLLAAALVGPSPARAEDPDAALDTRIIQKVLEGLGLRKDSAGINYQERAPLVIPPGRALPPPERADAAIANNPEWPKDPDVLRRKQDAAAERNRDVSAEIERERGPLSPDQLAPGRRTAKRSRTLSDVPGTDPNANPRLTPAELGYKGGMFSTLFGGKEKDSAKFTGEPPRVSLTEPPPGYQTPSPAQPYGLSGAAEPPKAIDSHTVHGTEGY